MVLPFASRVQLCGAEANWYCRRQVGLQLNSHTVSPLGFTSRVRLSCFVGDQRVAVLETDARPRAI